MSTARGSILIVDDNVILRKALSIIFAEAGYQVRAAGDGFAALAEIAHRLPNLLLSDLNMPGMCGFELLSVVRRRFPDIRVIAMSSAFSGERVPQGVAADGFHEKGRAGVERLLRLACTLAESDNPPPRPSSVPIWISSTRLHLFDDTQVVMSCPHCLRVFSHSPDKSNSPAGETSCLHCSSAVQFALVQTAQPAGGTSLPGATEPGSKRDANLTAAWLRPATALPARVSTRKRPGRLL